MLLLSVECSREHSRELQQKGTVLDVQNSRIVVRGSEERTAKRAY